jgi:hypothetical protein
MNTSSWLHKWYSYRVGCIEIVVLMGAMIVYPACSSPVAAETCAGPDRACDAASETPIGSFQTFCDGWMEKLRDRELDHLANIKWQTSAEGVQGTYVGYSEDYTCTVSTDGPPVGRVEYREVRYEKRGITIAEAEQSSPQPVEICITTELFGYTKGKWQY